ncbi:CAP domain-containing protein [Jiangella asiatica]|uniref:CAP domain-containing protein n=1 Tax=Jiangella asiatica TaxID=2530372 RepID=A0A4R5CRY6_9ACTN|nr:CAP domain-containing protein [Jiangella asiatica]TDE01611.1 CAP domain-containing protein [Jiangella asiatica]
MRVRSAVVVVAAAFLALTGCADDTEPRAVPESSTSQPWPWEKYPPTVRPTPSPTPSTDPVEPAEPTAPPEPTAAETTEPPATPEPTEPAESPEPTAEPSEPDHPPATSSPTPTDSSPTLADEVVELTNEVRDDHGCPVLRADDRLAEAARLHSEDMVERDYFDHTSPDGDGPGERAARAGYDHWSGENIAMGYATAADVVEGWMDSEGHRANILNCDSQAIGVGVAESDRGLYWTQMFGAE